MRLNEGAAVAAAPDTMPEKNAIIVLGMHRSGTSALTRVISLLGAELPKRVLGAHESNERGHWEPDVLVAFHDRMLAELGSRWDDWRSWDSFRVGDDALARYRTEIQRILEQEYGEAPLFVLKDPRICRFVPLYESVLSEMDATVSYVIPVRNPLAVIASLHARNGMTDGFAALLWLRHVLDAEYATRGKARLFTTYEELMADWRGVVGKMAAAFALDWPVSMESASGNIRDHLTPGLQHHVFGEEDIAAGGGFHGWLKDAYTALLNLSTGHDEANFIILDRVRRSFEGFAAQAGEVIFPEMWQRESSFAAQIGFERGRADTEQNRAAHTQQLLDAQTQRADAEFQRAEAERRSAEAASLKAQEAHALAEAESRRAEAERVRTDLELRRAEAERRNAEAANLRAQEVRSFAEAETRRAEAERQRADVAEGEAARAHAARASEESERLKVIGEREALAVEAKTLRAHLRETEDGLEAARRELETRRREVESIRKSTSWRITAPLRAIRKVFS
jgi:hypothetical protein